MLRVSVVWVIELAVFHLTHGQVLARSPARPLALRSGNSTRTTPRWPRSRCRSHDRRPTRQPVPDACRPLALRPRRLCRRACAAATHSHHAAYSTPSGVRRQRQPPRAASPRPERRLSTGRRVLVSAVLGAPRCVRPARGGLALPVDRARLVFRHGRHGRSRVNRGGRAPHPRCAAVSPMAGGRRCARRASDVRVRVLRCAEHAAHSFLKGQHVRVRPEVRARLAAARRGSHFFALVSRVLRL